MLAGAYRLFGALAVFDVHIQRVPTDDPAFGVAQRKTAGVKPAIHSVGAPGTDFSIQRIPALNGMLPLGDGVRAIVRMHHFGPVLQLIHGHASVIKALSIYRLDLARHRSDTDQRR